MYNKSPWEDVLLTLLWVGEQLTRPTLYNLTESFEGWEYRRGLKRQLSRMEQRALLAREERAGQIGFRLTRLGRLAAMGGMDVKARWQRSWDGKWRMVLFALPVVRQPVRVKLLRWLRTNGFGYLQHSVWIHPDPPRVAVRELQEFRDDVEFFTIMEARCCAGHSNEALVLGAWDFREINQRYEGHLEFVAIGDRARRQLAASPTALGAWMRRERSA